jgi:hypothetical protein
MPTHYDDRRRRDTPAQERRHQTQVNRDFGALQQAGMFAQDRDRERGAVAGAVGAGSRSPLPQRSNTGSPTLTEAGRTVARGARAGATAAQDWRQRTLAADQSGPQALATRGGSLPSMPRGGGAGSGFTASQLASGQGTPPRGQGASPDFRGLRGTAQGSGFTDQQIARSQAGFTPSLNLRSPGQMARDGVDLSWLGGLANTERGLPGALLARPGLLGDASRFIGGRMLGQPGGGQEGASPDVSRETPQVSPSAIQAAQDIDATRGQGYFIGPDGRRQFVPGTQRVPDGPGGVRGPSFMGNMGAAADEFARANAIRQEMIDRQRPQNQVTIIPDSGAQGAGTDAQIERLVQQAGRTRDPRERATINRQIQQLSGVADRQSAMQRASMDQQTQLERTRMTEQGAGERNAAQIASRLLQTDTGQDAYNQARAEYQQIVNEAMRTGADRPAPQLDSNTVQAMIDAGRGDLAEQELLRYQAQRDAHDLRDVLLQTNLSEQDLLEAFMQGELDPEDRVYELMERAYGTPPQSFALGGEVMAPGMEDSMGPVGGAMSMAGDPVATGMTQPDPLQAQYEQYAQGAQQLGIQAVPFEEFLGMMQGGAPGAPPAPQPQQQFGAMGFALGGEIPDLSMGADPYDVSGQLVMDSDPMAGTDSIPAIIDEQHPAKLDSGEFVIPESVVRYHGLEKLNKLIAQAEEGQNGAGQRQASATQAVRS